MSIIAIIPARMASTRFPGKPLYPLCGMPMLGHVALRTSLSKAVDAVYVATCDSEIVDYCHSIGIKTIMTANTHERCIDRCAEATAILEESAGVKAETIVIVQGDEPLVHPAMLDAALKPFRSNSKIQTLNLMYPIYENRELQNPNTIKVVTNKSGKALYFSRSPIPFFLDNKKTNVFGYRQVCVMVFKRQALQIFMQLNPSPLEIAESIDMLRFLEHGHFVHMALSPCVSQSVDCLEDALLVETMLACDSLYSQYIYDK